MSFQLIISFKYRFLLLGADFDFSKFIIILHFYLQELKKIRYITYFTNKLRRSFYPELPVQ